MQHHTCRACQAPVARQGTVGERFVSAVCFGIAGAQPACAAERRHMAAGHRMILSRLQIHPELAASIDMMRHCPQMLGQNVQAQHLFGVFFYSAWLCASQVLTPVQSATLQVHVRIASPQHLLPLQGPLPANQLAVCGIINNTNDRLPKQRSVSKGLSSRAGIPTQS